MDDIDYSSHREKMVQTQIIKRGIQDPRTLEAMRHVPREKFIPPIHRSRAYDDRPIPIGEKQTVSQPYMVALMTQALMLRGSETVLEIGTGSGYQTAILARLARRVISMERLPGLGRRASETLQSLGVTNTMVMTGDGTRGDPEHAPFDAIMVTAGSPKIPDTLKAQLAEGGRLIIPVGNQAFQELKRVIRKGDSFTTENLGGCVFVPLIGAEGWKPEGSEESLRNAGGEV